MTPGWDAFFNATLWLLIASMAACPPSGAWRRVLVVGGCLGGALWLLIAFAHAVTP